MKTKPDIHTMKLRIQRLVPLDLTSCQINVDGLREHIKLRLQETLDELFIENLIPFKLTAYQVIPDGVRAYTIPFRDTRLHSISFFWEQGESFKEAIRVAVVGRLKRMSAPYEKLTA